MRRVDLITADGVRLVAYPPSAVPADAILQADDPRDAHRAGQRRRVLSFVWDGSAYRQRVVFDVGFPEVPQ